MGFLHPELLLLALPLGLVWWRTRAQGRVTLLLRAVVGALLVLGLAGPYTVVGDEGRDLVVLVDRSRSMPSEAAASVLELVKLAEEERRSGDRVHVVGFGAEARIEHVDTGGGGHFQGFEHTVDADGSDLGEAMQTALGLIGEGRNGAVLLVSDGEGNGRDPIPFARRAYARGVRIDVRDLHRPGVADLAVERIDLPGEVAVGEPFQFNVWVRADRRVETELKLRRGDEVLSSGTRVFEAGLNRVVMRDVLEHTGVAEYEVALGGVDDRIPENNRGLGAVRATGAPAVLVLNHDGAEDTLVRALRRAQIPVAVATPESARLDAVGLSGFRCVVLENVAASRLGRGMRALREHVLDRGAGLLMTGGRASFGIGGYHNSPIDDVLPVSMELRQEHRKFAVAMAIAMDRSGSMAMPASGSQTKMDLANAGASAAIELMSPNDHVAVIAVDSAAHVVVPMRPVEDPRPIADKVRTIQSMGGGIYVWEALDASLAQLDRSPITNKHVILFADAADSENPRQSVAVIEKLHRDVGLTLSVIALGTDKDADADLLKRLAAAGGGEAYFSLDPGELPRLFAMDTLKVSRSTFVEEGTAVRVLPDLFGLGQIPSAEFPSIAGYNLTYLRASATAGMVTGDEYKAPLFAFGHQGLGRSAAYTGQVGGSAGAEVVAWSGFGEFFVTATRWLLGQEEPEEFFTSVRREGRDAVLSVEVDPDAPLPPDTSDLAAVLSNESGERTEVVLERVGEHTFEARYPLEREGITLGTVRLGDDRFVSLPPVVLPYSPEFERSPDPDRGARLLRRLARESGGEVGVTAGSFFRGAREGSIWRLITRELMVAALVLLMIEIAGRRLALWGTLRLPANLERVVGRVRVAVQRRLPKRKPRKTRQPDRAGGVAPASSAEAEPEPEPGPPEPTVEQPTGSVGSALSRARKAADRKLGGR